jgi:hypothetical protein
VACLPNSNVTRDSAYLSPTMDVLPRDRSTYQDDSLEKIHRYLQWDIVRPCRTSACRLCLAAFERLSLSAVCLGTRSILSLGTRLWPKTITVHYHELKSFKF